MAEKKKQASHNMIKELLQGGLARSIQEIVARETAKALEQVKGGTIDQGERSQATGETILVNKNFLAASDEADRAESACSSLYSGPSRARAGAEILEPFDPDIKDCSVEKWLNKIDQLGHIYGWTEYERAYFMQAKLQGAARSWYTRLDRYDQTWGEWKQAIAQAFPRQQDFAELLTEMLARNKMDGESMTQYFHDKMAKIERCDFTGAKAISCLINGLPRELQANAKAFKCSSPGELYIGFLSSFDKYHQAEKRRNSGGQGSDTGGKLTRRQETRSESGIRCYNCQQIGTHISQDCPKPRLDRCFRCRQPGHESSSCPDRRLGGPKSGRLTDDGVRGSRGRL